MTTAAKQLRRGKQRPTIGDSPQGRHVPREEKQPDSTKYSGRVAARVRKLRVKNGMTREGLQTELAKHGLTVSMPTIYAWENGNKAIDPNNYPALAAALGCSTVRQFLPAE